VLAVDASDTDATASLTKYDAGTDFVLRRDATPVRTEILEGTGKETALALARAALEKLEQEWDDLTTQTPRYIGNIEDPQYGG
jgi:hypothetical protein